VRVGRFDERCAILIPGWENEQWSVKGWVKRMIAALEEYAIFGLSTLQEG
jgi:hypothetical protein